MYHRLGIDIGGTFTDLVLVNDETNKIYFGKTLTTYPDPIQGIIHGISELIKVHQKKIEDIHTIVHGTTLITNTVIERKGAKTALLTTKDFEDVLEIGREMRYDIYDIYITMPKPLIPTELRLGIEERMDKGGQVISEINKEEIRNCIQKLIDQEVKSVAVCYLHSYVNDEHELVTKKIIEEEFPSLYYTLSSEVMPEIREYERSSATAMNAYVQPIATEYLSTLKLRLKEHGFDKKIYIMDSAGRLTTLEGAAKFPIQLLESGPAGGTMATVYIGEMIGKRDLLAFDMGGTTAKASLIKDAEPSITHHFEAAREKRFKKGSGLPVRIPVVDMIEIGAGGGSIAYINNLGLLTVGPESASSNPGPACYGLGGQNPTVTDADLVLGYLNPDYFLGGTMTLDVELAKQSIKNKIADPLGIAVEEAAWGIHRVVNENMASAARVHIVEKGLDPRSFSMIAFGGAGPVHAFHTARLLYGTELIVPSGAGVLSAFGFLVSPVAKEEILTYVSTVDDVDWSVLNQKLEALIKTSMKFVTSVGVDPSDITTTISCDMRYRGQGHEINIKIPQAYLNASYIKDIKSNFESAYERLYGRIIKDMDIEFITWRILFSGPKAKLNPSQSIIGDQSTLLKNKRRVYWGNSSGYIETPVYNRYAMGQGLIIEGPCIIEEFESTTVVGENATATIDEYKNIIIKNYYPT
jgi:N-methylhydantoinase A